MGGFNVEVLIIVFAIIGAVLVLGLVVFELFEGVWSLDMLDGDDEEWIAPLAMLSLLIFLAALSYFG